MRLKPIIERLWAIADNLLLFAVITLLSVAWYAADRGGGAQETLNVRAMQQATSPVRRVQPPRPPWVVDGTRVSLGAQERMRSIARSMAATDWDRIPPSPAMDMREDGKTYEVYFSLPEGIDQDSVRVMGHGNVLTLAMKNADTGKMYMQRIRVPCVCDSKENLQSSVSNDVLRVRITP